MAKPYSIFRKSSGIYYVQFPLTDGGRSNIKSTGTRVRSEAEKTAMEWMVNGNIPNRINSKDKTEKLLTMSKLTFFNMLRTIDLPQTDVKTVIKIMKERGLISSAVLPATPESISAENFLRDFWDYEKSPYIKEKTLKGESIHRSYCETMRSRIKLYWLPRLAGKTIGSIVRDDIKTVFEDPEILKLAHKTINGIVSSVTIPLKWAYYNSLTQNNCFDGIIKCSQKGKQRKILTMEQAAAVFKIDWENDSAKLANAVAMYTGMRQGEIAALRAEDIGTDRLYVKHSWSKYDSLKCCKNGEEREVPIAPQIRNALIAQARLNPYGEGMKGFIFFSLKPQQPTDPKNWLKYLHRALKDIGYSNPKEICFHSWRHLWCSRVCDIIEDKRVVMAGSGHKTETMLNHYAEHIESKNAMTRLQSAEATLFLPVLAGTPVQKV